MEGAGGDVCSRDCVCVRVWLGVRVERLVMANEGMLHLRSGRLDVDKGGRDGRPPRGEGGGGGGYYRGGYQVRWLVAVTWSHVWGSECGH
jgi:hypothetical protein